MTADVAMFEISAAALIKNDKNEAQVYGLLCGVEFEKPVVNITVQSSLFEYGNVAGVWAGGCMYSLFHDKLSIFYGRVAVNRTS